MEKHGNVETQTGMFETKQSAMCSQIKVNIQIYASRVINQVDTLALTTIFNAEFDQVYKVRCETPYLG